MIERSKLWHLENFNLFQTLDTPQLGELERMTGMQKVQKGSLVYFPDDEARNIYILKEGRIKISKVNEEGREIIYNLVGPGELFGELALIDDQLRDEMAMAMEDSVMCYVSVSDFQTFVQANPKLNFAVTKLIGLKFKKVRHKMETLWFKSTSERVRHFLHDLAEDHGRQVGFETEIRLNLTHQDIANLTATNRQTVTTIMRQLQRDNVITYDRRRILIRDKQALLAEPSSEAAVVN